MEHKSKSMVGLNPDNTSTFSCECGCKTNAINAMEKAFKTVVHRRGGTTRAFYDGHFKCPACETKSRKEIYDILYQQWCDIADIPFHLTKDIDID